MNNRYNIALIFFSLFWFMLISRLYQLGVQEDDLYKQEAMNISQKKIFVKPVRGEILDRHGKLLAMNDIGFVIKIDNNVSIDKKTPAQKAAIKKENELAEKVKKEAKELEVKAQEKCKTKCKESKDTLMKIWSSESSECEKKCENIKVVKKFKRDPKLHEISSKEVEGLVDILVKEFPDLKKEKMMKAFYSKYSVYNHKPITVVDFIPYEQMIGAYTRLNIYPKIIIEAETKRYYPYGDKVSHVIGYVSKSNDKENNDSNVSVIGVVGKAGLEKQYNNILQGNLGYKLIKVSATNQEVETIRNQPVLENQDLHLNIDMGLQSRIYELFYGQAGAAVVMDVNGDVIAAVSYPSFDANWFVNGITGERWKYLMSHLDYPFTNKFISGTYPPGSTIKMGSALAFAMNQQGLLDSNEHCSGGITIGRSGHRFRCWNNRGHGGVDLRKAIRESCDVYFYNKNLQIGIDKWSKSLHSMGFGEKTGIDLPNEKKGLIPTQEWKQKRFKQPWFAGETAIAAIGQGYDLATPMQLARYTAFLATKKLPTPHLVHKIVNKEVMPEYQSVPNIDDKYLNTIRMGMYDVCNTGGGTAVGHMSRLPVIVAGKTGTSQVVKIAQGNAKRASESSMDYYSRSHAWLTTYAPFQKPKYVVTVLVEHGGHGGSASGPIAAEIYRWMAAHHYFDEKVGKLELNISKETNNST
ncbi:MAG: penicillin-binding protein 2, partial [Epsilonproteobacteria bacterium]|nr:penicillin-binding protein 2 [Campylobacterota bacterium]